jgi:L-fuculose-phosphate aldolase
MRGSGEHEPARARVVGAAHRLAAAGLVIGTAGNLSERTGDHVAISATGARLGRLDASEVTIVDLDGRVVAGELEPTSELALHLEVYRRFETGAVVHTHAPIGCALSCVLDELPCVHYAMLELGGPIRVAPYRTFGTPELAHVTADALEGRRAALMANHGSIAHGADIERAVDHAELLEWLATLYWRAAAIGSPRILDEGALAAVADAVAARHYGTTKPHA